MRRSPPSRRSRRCVGRSASCPVHRDHQDHQGRKENVVKTDWLVLLAVTVWSVLLGLVVALDLAVSQARRDPWVPQDQWVLRVPQDRQGP